MKTQQILFALLLVTGGSAFAAISAVSFTGGTLDHYADDTIGFRFTVGTSDISVSALGFYDEGADGLADSHAVGIFDVATRLSLTSTTIPNGTGGTLDGGFRFVDVAPVTLLAGATYVINAYRPTDADGILRDVSTLITAPFLTYITEVAANSTGGLVFIDTPFGEKNGWFGPNLKADVVPEVPAGAEINIQVTGGNIVITYSGTLQSSLTMATGSWGPVAGAPNPYQFPVPTSGRRFFRAVR